MRAFLALDLPEEAEAPLMHLQERIPVGRPTDPETFHVTLAFLGDDLDPETLEALHDDLITLRGPPVTLSVEGVETYGASSPAVLVARVPLTDPLRALQTRVAHAARRAGIALERRRFKPHVTLARFRHRVAGPDHDRLTRFLEAEARFRLDPWTVPQVTLYASTLTKAGPMHEPLQSYPLLG